MRFALINKRGRHVSNFSYHAISTEQIIQLHRLGYTFAWLPEFLRQKQNQELVASCISDKHDFSLHTKHARDNILLRHQAL